MKKSSLLLLAPAMLALVATSCGPKAPESSDKPSKTENVTTEVEDKYVPVMDHEVNINIWHSFGKTIETALQGMVTDFCENYETNINITLTKVDGSYPGLRKKIISGFATDLYPDMTICYPDHVADYIDYNKAVDFTPYMKNKEYGWTEEDLDDIFDMYLKEGSSFNVSGMYCLPFAKSTEAMFYNTNITKIALPGVNDGNQISEEYLNNLTWNELFDNLIPKLIDYNNKELAKPESERKPLYTPAATNKDAIFAYDSDDNVFITLAEQSGAGYTEIDQASGVGKLLFDNAKNKENMKMLNKNKNHMLSKGSNGSYTSDLFKGNNTLFTIGSTGGTSYNYSDKFEVGVAKVPHFEGENPAVINQGPSLCILERGNEDAKIASWLFYKWITGTDKTCEWARRTSYMPVRQSSYETKEWLAYADIAGNDDLDKLLAKVAVYNTQIREDFFVSPAFHGSATAREAVGKIVTGVLTTKETGAKFDTYLDGLFTTAVNDAKKGMN